MGDCDKEISETMIALARLMREKPNGISPEELEQMAERVENQSRSVAKTLRHRQEVCRS